MGSPTRWGRSSLARIRKKFSWDTPSPVNRMSPKRRRRRSTRRFAASSILAMVTRYGFSDELGPIEFGENQEEVFLGHSVARQQNVSEATAQKIDAEIPRIIDTCYGRAHDILTQRIDDLHTLARGLLEYETLTGDEIIALLKGIAPVRTPYEEPEPQRGPGSSVPSAGRPRVVPTPEPQPGR